MNGKLPFPEDVLATSFRYTAADKDQDVDNGKHKDAVIDKDTDKNDAKDGDNENGKDKRWQIWRQRQ